MDEHPNIEGSESSNKVVYAGIARWSLRSNNLSVGYGRQSRRLDGFSWKVDALKLSDGDIGIRKAFEDYEQRDELAWKQAS